MERSFRVVAGFLFAASLFSCNFSKVEDFTLGKDFVSSTSGVVMIDTMRMVVSTVHLDSITTSKVARLLVGGNENSYTGKVTCTPYFQFHSGSFPLTFATDLVYDSLVIKYNYDGYFIGDTTKLISFSTRQLSPKLGYNSNGSLYNISPFKLGQDGHLYNTSSFALSNNTLGEVQFYPHPKSKKDFYFRLSDTYGDSLFHKILAKNDSMQNLSNFQVFLPGVALFSAPNQNQSAVGIPQSSLSLRIYYHKIINEVESPNPTFFNFPIDATGVWYNQILYTSHGSMLGNISVNTNPNVASTELPSTNTNNQTMVQGGSGLYTKIRIPGSQYLKGYGKNTVLISAKIQLTPDLNSYSVNNPLPDTLAVYIIDWRNVISSQYSSSLGSNIFATKVVPGAYDEVPYYVLDVTQFFTNEFASPTITGNSLMLGTLGNKTGQNINYLSFSGNALNKNIFKMQIFCYIDKSN